MYSLIIILLGIIPTALLFLVSRIEPRAIGPTPMTIMAWTWLIGYTLKSFYLSYAVPYQLPFRPSWIAADIIHVGQFAIILGVVSMIVGYFLSLHLMTASSKVTPLPKLPRSDPRPIYYAFFAISGVLLIAYFYQMGFIEQVMNLHFFASKFYIDETGARNALGFLSIGGDFLLVLFIYYVALARKLTWVNPYTISIAFLALSYFLASRRNGFLVMVILVLIVVAARGIDRDILKKTIRYGLFAVTMIIGAFSSQVRDESRDGVSYEQLDVASAVGSTATHAFEGAYFIDPAKTAAIVDQVGRTEDLFWGSSFAAFIFAPIPRVIWPNKPDIRTGPYVAQVLFNFGSNSGVPPGAIGEFYLNFSWFGIVAGMMLLGMFCALIWRRHLFAEDQRFTLIRFAFWMMAAIFFLAVEFSAAIVIFIKYFIAILVAERYWRWTYEKEGMFAPRREERQLVPRVLQTAAV